MAQPGYKKFNFVSPGIFLNEIDKSQISKPPLGIGPMVIGRARRGPGMRPTRVSSYAEFVQIFGNPNPGIAAGDQFRSAEGPPGPTYAAYAAQAWLANNTPLTFMRLVGTQHSQATDSSAYGSAGWFTSRPGTYNTETVMQNTIAAANNGGAYGLWLIPSSSDDQVKASGSPLDSAPATGTLAAIFYVAEGTLRLTGSVRDSATTHATTGACAAIFRSDSPDGGFTMDVMAAGGKDDDDPLEKISFNFAQGSAKHVRKAFNTNPTLTNAAITTNTKTYWLGESFEKSVQDMVLKHSSSAGSVYGILLGLDNGDAGGDWSNHRYAAQPARTPWLFSQYIGQSADFSPSKCQKLFRLVTHQAGQWDMHSLKIAIEEIKPSTSDKNAYGTFTVTIREISDHDGDMKIVERFSGCNLNPGSPNYIGTRIGTQYVKFDSVQRRLRNYGKYRNRSQYVYVEMNEELDQNGLDPSFLPFGWEAPPQPYDWALLGPNGESTGIGVNGEIVAYGGSGGGSHSGLARTKMFLASGEEMPHSDIDSGQAYAPISSSNGFTGSFKWPTLTCRSSSADGGFVSPTKAYFGFYTGKSTSDITFEASTKDLLRPLPKAINGYLPTTDKTVSPFWFTLDDLSGSAPDGAGYAGSVNPDPNLNNHVVWVSGSRKDDKSISALSVGSAPNADGVITDANLNPDGWRYLLQKMKINKFMVPMYGGSDGLDIREKEPFRNQLTSPDGTTAKTHYAYNAIEEALDIISATEDYEFNIATMPGITTSGLTKKLVDICEERADALAIIDLEDVYTPTTEVTKSSVTDRYGVARDVALKLTDRQINSSYGCAYYPWVQIQDTATGINLFSPPSVAALGTFSSSEAATEPWFAPAGFNRGGLSDGAAGIPVIGVTEKLTAKDRDLLYEANINPIASFPAEGIVVFGQKTLQITPSALDRINVRRLLIFVKKAVSRFSAKVLFDQNVQVTWNRFIGMVEPFLKSVQTRLGLEDFRITLDSTTTTPDLVDRNIMYAKIYLKPARAIEFIVVDFVITSSGASFDD